MGWYTGIHIAEDLDVDVCSATNKCKDCDHNNQGYCEKEKEWVHMFKGCVKKPVKIKEETNIVGITGVYKKTNGTYAVKFKFNGKLIHVGTYGSEMQAIKALAKREVKLYGRRQRNRHVEV